jgi:hypothetical protein
LFSHTFLLSILSSFLSLFSPFPSCQAFLCPIFFSIFISSSPFFHYPVMLFHPFCLLRYNTLHYITLHYITLHYITLHYITLHVLAPELVKMTVGCGICHINTKTYVQYN